MRFILFIAVIVAGALIYSTSAQSSSQQVPRLTPLKLKETAYWCPDHKKFVKWISESNKFGPIILEKGVIEKYGCKATSIALMTNKFLGMVRAFNVPVLAIEAEAANEGTVYTFVPILPSLPFEPGVGA